MQQKFASGSLSHENVFIIKTLGYFKVFHQKNQSF